MNGPAGGRCGWWFWLAGLVLVVGPFGVWGAAEGGSTAVDAVGGARVPPSQVLFGLVLGEASEEELKARLSRVRQIRTDPYTGGPVYEAVGEDLPEPGFSRAEFIFGAGRLVAVRLYYRTGLFGRRFREHVRRLSAMYVKDWSPRLFGGRMISLKSREVVPVEGIFLPEPKVRVHVSERVFSFEGEILYETPAYFHEDLIEDRRQRSVGGATGVSPGQVLFGLVLGEASEEELKARIPRVRQIRTDRYTGEPVYEAAGEDLPEPGFSRAVFIFGEGRLVAVRLYYRTGLFGRRFREHVRRLLKRYKLQHMVVPMLGNRRAYLKTREKVWIEVLDEFEFVPKVRVSVYEWHSSFEGEISYVTHAYDKALREYSALEQQRAIERVIREASKVKPPSPR